MVVIYRSFCTAKADGACVTSSFIEIIYKYIKTNRLGADAMRPRNPGEKPR